MESEYSAPVRRPNSLWEIVKAVLISIAIVIPVRWFVAQPFIVDGASMEPNFHGSDYLIVDELTYQFLRSPERGEVVIFRYPLNPSHFFIKRVIGLPGETVMIENSHVRIKQTNGTTIELPQRYLSDSAITSPDLSFTVEQGQYFVMGDNRLHSSDSRIWGALPKSNITGRVFVRLWPLSAIDYLPNNPSQ